MGSGGGWGGGSLEKNSYINKKKQKRNITILQNFKIKPKLLN